MATSIDRVLAIGAENNYQTGMDGYEVARRMRALPDLADTNLVALTGYAGLDDRKRAAEAGFVRHLVKPIDFSERQKVLLESLVPCADTV